MFISVCISLFCFFFEVNAYHRDLHLPPHSFPTRRSSVLEDHKRLYGSDFSDRLHRAGFVAEVFRADPESEVRYGLRRGDRFFLARPAAELATEIGRAHV